MTSNMTLPGLLDNSHEFTLPLRDGELVDFRPVRQADRETIQHGMSGLSLQSRYFRFFTPIAKLSDAQLHYFTEVDQQNHIAWIALAHDQPGHPGLGIARFIRMKKQPTMAEFAVVVLDSHQQQGLGTILMAILYRMAAIKSIQTLRGFILPENTVMNDWHFRLVSRMLNPQTNSGLLEPIQGQNNIGGLRMGQSRAPLLRIMMIFASPVGMDRQLRCLRLLGTY